MSRATYSNAKAKVRQNQPGKLKVWAEMELKDRLFSANFVDVTRGAMRAWLSTIDRAAEADGMCERLAKYHIDTYFPALLVIAEHYSGEEFTEALNRQIALWRNTERLHGVVDYVFLHGVPPPVESPGQLLESARGTSLEMVRLRHRLNCAKHDIIVPKTDMEEKTATVARWKREVNS